MFPAFAHFRRTATRDVELRRPDDPRGREGRHVVRRRRTATSRATRTPTASTSTATPSTRRSAPAAGTSASAPRWPGSSCGSCSRRRSARFPEMELAGDAASTPSRRSSTSSRRCRCGCAPSGAPQPEQLQIGEERHDRRLQGDPDRADGLGDQVSSRSATTLPAAQARLATAIAPAAARQITAGRAVIQTAIAKSWRGTRRSRAARGRARRRGRRAAGRRARRRRSALAPVTAASRRRAVRGRDGDLLRVRVTGEDDAALTRAGR